MGSRPENDESPHATVLGGQFGFSSVPSTAPLAVNSYLIASDSQTTHNVSSKELDMWNIILPTPSTSSPTQKGLSSRPKVSSLRLPTSSPSPTLPTMPSPPPLLHPPTTSINPTSSTHGLGPPAPDPHILGPSDPKHLSLTDPTFFKQSVTEPLDPVSQTSSPTLSLLSAFMDLDADARTQLNRLDPIMDVTVPNGPAGPAPSLVHIETLAGDLVGPPPGSSSQELGHHDDIGSSPAICGGAAADGYSMQLSCSTKDDMRFIIEPAQLPRLTCESVSEPLGPRQRKIFTVTISVQPSSANSNKNNTLLSTMPAPHPSTIHVHANVATVPVSGAADLATQALQSEHGGRPADASNHAPPLSVAKTGEDGMYTGSPANTTINHNGGRALNHPNDGVVEVAKQYPPPRLKRKPTTSHTITTASPGSGAMDVDGIPIEDARQTKKSKQATKSQPLEASGSRRTTATRPSRSSPSTAGSSSPTTGRGILSAPINKGATAQSPAAWPTEKALFEQKIEFLEAQLAASHTEVLHLRSLTDQALSPANEGQQVTAPPHVELIPRPRGQRGKEGWNLQKQMGLEDDRETYNNIRRGVRYAISESGIDFWERINKQDVANVVACYTLVSKRFPYMTRFDSDWATRELIKSICEGVRKYCRKKGLGVKCKTIPKELLDGDEYNEDDDDAAELEDNVEECEGDD